MHYKLLKTLLKIGFTLLAIYLAFRKVNYKDLMEVLDNFRLIWVFPTVSLYVLSKFLTAERQFILFDDLKVSITRNKNLRLYFLGMFYNLFLPGGIGGDGYKAIYVKNKVDHNLTVILKSLLLDRLSGLVAILFLLSVTAFFIDFNFLFAKDLQIGLLIAICALLYPCYYLFNNYLFKNHRSSFIRVNLLSFLGQFCQIISAIFILLGLGVKSNFLAYIYIFLISSIATIIPITIGGIGVRELIFLYSYEALGLYQNVSIGFSLLFFLVSVMASIPGVLFMNEFKLSNKS